MENKLGKLLKTFALLKILAKAKDTSVVMTADEAVREHEHLVDVLHSHNPKKENKEAAKQAEELKEYKEKLAESDLEKGLNGDWQKEGYKLHHTVDTFGMPHQPENHQHKITVNTPQGKPAASFIFENVKGQWMPTSAQVHPEHRRKGIATGVYNYFENKTGNKLQPHHKQSEEAGKLWNQPNRLFGKSEGEEKHLKTCSGCGTHITTKNAKFIGVQETPKSMPYNLYLYNCPSCNTTITNKVPKSEVVNKSEDFEELEKEDKPLRPGQVSSHGRYVADYHPITNQLVWHAHPAVAHATDSYIRQNKQSFLNKVHPQYRQIFSDLIDHTLKDKKRHIVAAYDDNEQKRPGIRARHIKSLMEGHSHIQAIPIDPNTVHLKMQRHGLGSNFNTVHNIKFTNRQRLAASELYKSEMKRYLEDMGYFQKGVNGNWQKEGYTIQHKIELNPRVDPKNDWDDYDHTIFVTAHDKDGKQVGQAPMLFHPRRGNMVPISTKVDKVHQRKGLATAMYQHAEKVIGQPVLSENFGGRNADSDALWNQPNRNLKFGDDRIKKSELNKGQNGDWQKEGFKLTYHPHPKDESYFQIHAHDKEGNKAGQAEFSHHLDGKHITVYDDGLPFEDTLPKVVVRNAYRRKGLATGMYQMAERVTGKKLKNVGKNRRTDAGKALWSQSNRSFGKSDWQDSYLLRKSEAEQPTTLYHYSRQPGLKALDPKQMGTGAPGQFSSKFNPSKIPDFPHTTFAYIKDEPEDIVKHGSHAKYTLKLSPDQHLYDLSTDKEGLVRDAVKENGGAWNYENVLNKIKHAGHYGIWASKADHPVIANTVQLFYPHPTHKEEGVL